jgi:hypothetical protein
MMNRFDGTAARQLQLIDPDELAQAPRPAEARQRPRPANIRLLKQDVYAELTRRRRRAQIAARHAIGE